MAIRYLRAIADGNVLERCAALEVVVKENEPVLVAVCSTGDTVSIEVSAPDTWQRLASFGKYATQVQWLYDAKIHYPSLLILRVSG